MRSTTFILDTSAYSVAQRGDERLLALLDEAQHIYIPVIVIGELLGGFAHGTKAAENKRNLTKFLADPVVSVLYIGGETPGYFAEIYAELRRAGRSIGQNDLWIAALAREHQLALLTIDNDFSVASELEIID